MDELSLGKEDVDEMDALLLEGDETPMMDEENDDSILLDDTENKRDVEETTLNLDESSGDFLHRG